MVMADIITENLWTIKSMDMENLSGQMIRNIEDNGRRERDMELVYLLVMMEKKGRGNGGKGSLSGG